MSAIETYVDRESGESLSVASGTSSGPPTRSPELQTD
jgi:hypothetical protein